jgi:hypothetical protein
MNQRTKIYHSPAEQQADERQAISAGWHVVSREQVARNTVRVIYQYPDQNEWGSPVAAPAPIIHQSVVQPPQTGVSHAIGQGFGWGCGCLLVIVVIVGGLIVLGAANR